MHEAVSRNLGALAGAGSALLLIAAFAFQAAGYAPCELCILQRWPHLAAALIGMLAWVTGGQRAVLWLGVLAALAATGLAGYHAGVEYGFWPGPSACAGGADLGGISTADLLARIEGNTHVIRCDEPALKVLGVTMAGANAVASAMLTALWLFAARRRG